MEIKTKYNIGDKVWFIHQNKCVSMEVENILMNGKDMYVQYTFNNNEIWLSENHLFPTKEELLKSL